MIKETNSLRPGVPMRAILGVMLCNCFGFVPSTHYFGRAWLRENGLAPPSTSCATQILRVHLTSCFSVQPSQGHERCFGRNESRNGPVGTKTDHRTGGEVGQNVSANVIGSGVSVLGDPWGFSPH